MKSQRIEEFGPPNREELEHVAAERPSSLFKAENSHFISYMCGWWNHKVTGEPLDRNVPEMLCLIHSEISEAMEAYRKDKRDDHLPQHPGLAVELADAVIRIYDLADAAGFDLDQIIGEKMAYNIQRADHKVENRVKPGGKDF